MLRYIIEVSLCWAVFYLLYHFWLQRETFFNINRWYLLGSLILGLLVPLIELPAVAFGASQPLSVVYQAPAMIDYDWLEVAVVPQETTDSPALIWLILSWGYWLGVSLASLRFLYGLGQIGMLYKNGEVISRPGFKLVQTKQAHLPFSFFNLLFQSQEVSLLDEDEHQIHRHELAHISGWHSLDVLLVELIGIALWCSPMVYIYRRSLRDVHEFLADAAVLKTTRKKQYSQLLFRQFQSGLQIALANHFIRSQFKTRIKMMTKRKSRNGALLKYLLVLPVLALALLAFTKRSALAGEDTQLPSTSAETYIMTADSIYQQVEIMPRFAGCEDIDGNEGDKTSCAQKKMFEFIYSNIKYPKVAHEKGVEGMVVISFVVNKDGAASDFRIVRDIGAQCGEEALRAIKGMPQWIPGRHKGQPVAVEMKLPIRFMLENGKKTADTYDSKPRYPGCEDLASLEEKENCAQKEFLMSIYKAIKYPKEARAAGIEGVVIVSFTIDEQGQLTNSIIRQEPGGGLGDEVLRILQDMPRWIPGQKDGKAVAVEMTIPVKFRLESDERESKPAQTYDVMPLFAGCEQLGDVEEQKLCTQKKLTQFLSENIKYPKSAKELGMEGKVIVKLTIDEQGNVRATDLLRKVGGGLDEEALRVVNMLPRWQPAQKDGKAVTTELTLPVAFRLPEKDKGALPIKHDEIVVTGYAVPTPDDHRPRFPGCETEADPQTRANCAQKRLLEYIFKNIKYPKAARDAGIEGTVVSSFIVAKDGSIGEIEILRSQGNGMDEEVKRVIQSMNQMGKKWIPGKKAGKTVAMEVTLPVKFALSNPYPIQSREPKESFDALPIIGGCENLSNKKEIHGCTVKKLKKFIDENIEYPEIAKEHGVQGKVFIEATIDENGILSDPVVIRDLGAKLGTEALRLVNLMPKWHPAQKDGKPIALRTIIPIHFELPQQETPRKEVLPATLELKDFSLSPQSE